MNDAYRALLMREREDETRTAKKCKFGLTPRLGYTARRSCDCTVPCSDKEACSRRIAEFNSTWKKEH